MATKLYDSLPSNSIFSMAIKTCFCVVPLILFSPTVNNDLKNYKIESLYNTSVLCDGFV